MIREVITEHTGITPPPWPADVPSASYGTLSMSLGPTLLEALPLLSQPISVEQPVPMEELLALNSSIP